MTFVGCVLMRMSGELANERCYQMFVFRLVARQHVQQYCSRLDVKSISIIKRPEHHRNWISICVRVRALISTHGNSFA